MKGRESSLLRVSMCSFLTSRTFVVPDVIFFAVCTLQCVACAVFCLVLLCAFSIFWLLCTCRRFMAVGLAVEALLYLALWGVSLRHVMPAFYVDSVEDAVVCLF